MSRDGINEDIAAALSGENVPMLALAQLDFESGTVYVTNNAYNLTWDGHTWLGVGRLGTIEKIDETPELEAKGVTLRLAGVPTDMLAIALGEHYQGRTGRIWAAPLDADYQIITDPVLAFNGRMDTMPILMGGATSEIKLNIESRLVDWERPRVRRFNDADQQQEYPGDLGLQFVEEMVEKELVWGRG